MRSDRVVKAEGGENPMGGSKNASAWRDLRDFLQ